MLFIMAGVWGDFIPNINKFLLAIDLFLSGSHVKRFKSSLPVRSPNRLYRIPSRRIPESLCYDETQRKMMKS